MKFLADWLVKRAKRTPYFHLDGYMRRWWLVPYRQMIVRTIEAEVGDNFKAFENVTDGTGPVAFHRRPIVWLFQRLGIAIRVHEILRSDHGRDPHDHPWPYLTVILRGGYWESRYTPQGVLLSKEWHGPGSILFRPANSWHRLDVNPGEVATTLFITGPKAQRWGFLVNGEKVPYEVYLGQAHD
jgi:hypothetical protein